MTRLSFRFAKRKSTAQCLWALRFACSVLAAAVSVDIPAEERGTGAVVSLDHSAADLKVPPDAGVIPVPGTDPIRIAVITFALPRDNLLIAEATKLALAPLFPNRGIKLIFCTFEEFDRIVLSRGAEFILGTSGAVTRLSTFGLRPLATLVSKGGPDPNRNEGAAVIVREDHREFQTLGDLKGRTIAASNALSFPGWQIVLGEVAKFGINPNAFFGKTIFTGDARSISDIVKLILDDKADAGVLRLCAYEQFIERHPEAVGELRVLDRRDNVDVACVHSTDLYPGFTMAVTELISPEAARRATLALLSMPPTERGARWTIPTNYKSVDALLEAIRVGPSEKLRATMLNELIDDYLTWMLVIALLILGLLFHGWRAEVLARRQGERVRELMEQKMAQASRLASMQRAASLTQISSIFAHELRQPLTSASLYAEGLARQIRRGSADPDRMAKIADRIADETQRASEIVERVRAYAKGRRLERSVLSAADVMQSAVRLWRGQSMRDFPLWVLVPKSAAHISANAFELELVFVNLLKNAAEAAQAAWAADESSGKPKPVNLTKAPDVLVGSGPMVAFTAEVIGSSVVFMVADSGKPLSDEALLRIEAGSSQPQAGSSQKSNGLGIGLAIVRSIVEACFGAITFGRTDLNPRLTGLAVRVALPLVSTSQSGRAQTDVSIPVPHEPAAESEMTAAPIIRIVDDDPNIHDALAYVLENEGFIVRHYESAESFLINDRPEDPGCAILDVRMGEMSGIVLHDRMKKLGSKLPCIFLSAHGDVDMAVDAIEAGAVTFLSKPVRTEKLLAAIERALTIAQSLASGDPGQTLDGTPASETALTDEAARQAALTEAARTAFLSLSDRERQTALLAVSGLTNRQIAERLEIAVRTVEFHRAGSMRKLGCHSAAELKAKLSLVPEAREAFE